MDYSRKISNILHGIGENPFQGIIDILIFYRSYFIDKPYHFVNEDNVPELIRLMNQRVGVNTLIEHLSHYYGIEDDIVKLFSGVLGEEYDLVLKEYLGKNIFLPGWLKEYISLTNICKESPEKICTAGTLENFDEIYSDTVKLLNGKLSENNVNVLIEYFYLREKKHLASENFQQLLSQVKKDMTKTLPLLFCKLLYNVRDLELLRTLFSRYYLTRLAWLISERLSVGFISEPYIFLATTPRKYLLKKRLTVIFGSFEKFFKNALWEMTNDASFMKEYGIDISIEGVHLEWIDLKTANIFRVIYRKDTNMVETPIYPIKPENVIVLNLNLKDERAEHCLISEYLERRHVKLINPYIASSRCDSKYLTHKFIETYNEQGNNILMPEYVYIPVRESASDIKRKIKEFFHKHDRIVVKPDHGTEGIGVKVFEKEEQDNAIKYIVELSRMESVIVEEFVGNVYYDKTRSFSLRVVVSHNGREFNIEGGYCIVARPHGKISSVSHGGEIKNPNYVLRNIWVKGHDGISQYAYRKNDLANLYTLSKGVANGINIGLPSDKTLRYMGLDFILKYDERTQSINYILLEINSRPSALTYLRELNPFSNMEKISIVKNLLKSLE